MIEKLEKLTTSKKAYSDSPPKQNFRYPLEETGRITRNGDAATTCYTCHDNPPHWQLTDGSLVLHKATGTEIHSLATVRLDRAMVSSDHKAETRDTHSSIYK